MQQEDNKNMPAVAGAYQMLNAFGVLLLTLYQVRFPSENIHKVSIDLERGYLPEPVWAANRDHMLTLFLAQA